MLIVHPSNIKCLWRQNGLLPPDLTNERSIKRLNERTFEWANEKPNNERTNERTDERTKLRTNEWTKEWKNERNNERTNEQRTARTWARATRKKSRVVRDQMILRELFKKSEEVPSHPTYGPMNIPTFLKKCFVRITITDETATRCFGPVRDVSKGTHHRWRHWKLGARCRASAETVQWSDNGHPGSDWVPDKRSYRRKS